jgi:hypothetical protein
MDKDPNILIFKKTRMAYTETLEFLIVSLLPKFMGY